MIQLPDRFLSKVKMTDSCWLWNANKNKHGYGTYKNKNKSLLAHRFSWSSVNGDIPNGMNILHKCDVRNCVNPDHLFIGTHTDNMRDMVNKGRYPIRNGEKNGRSKLKNKQAEEIRSVYIIGNNHLAIKFLAKMHGVSPTTIYRVRNNTLCGDKNAN